MGVLLWGKTAPRSGLAISGRQWIFGSDLSDLADDGEEKKFIIDTLF